MGEGVERVGDLLRQAGRVTGAECVECVDLGAARSVGEQIGLREPEQGHGLRRGVGRRCADRPDLVGVRPRGVGVVMFERDLHHDVQGTPGQGGAAVACAVVEQQARASGRGVLPRRQFGVGAGLEECVDTPRDACVGAAREFLSDALLGPLRVSLLDVDEGEDLGGGAADQGVDDVSGLRAFGEPTDRFGQFAGVWQVEPSSRGVRPAPQGHGLGVDVASGPRDGQALVRRFGHRREVASSQQAKGEQAQGVAEDVWPPGGTSPVEGFLRRPQCVFGAGHQADAGQGDRRVGVCRRFVGARRDSRGLGGRGGRLCLVTEPQQQRRTVRQGRGAQRGRGVRRGRQRPIRGFEAFREPPGGTPPEAEGYGEAQGIVRPVGVGVGERGAEVRCGVFAFVRSVGAAGAGPRALREREVVEEVAVAEHFAVEGRPYRRVVGHVRGFVRVVTDRREHAEQLPVRRQPAGDKGFVCQGVEVAGDHVRRQVFVGTHGNCGGCGPRPSEDREASEQHAFGDGQPVVAPVDGRVHRAVACVAAASAVCEHPQVERVGDLADAEHPHAGCGEFDGQGDAVDGPDDAVHVGEGLLGEGHISPGEARTVDEQPRGVGVRVAGGVAGVRVRARFCAERRDRPDELGGGVQGFARGGEDPYVRARCQEHFDDAGSLVGDVVAAVQDQEQPASAQDFGDRVDRVLVRGADTWSDRVQQGDVDRLARGQRGCQVDEGHVVAGIGVVGTVPGEADGQSGLPDAGRTDERGQAVFRAEGVGQSGEFVPASDEAGGAVAAAQQPDIGTGHLPPPSLSRPPSVVSVVLRFAVFMRSPFIHAGHPTWKNANARPRKPFCKKASDS